MKAIITLIAFAFLGNLANAQGNLATLSGTVYDGEAKINTIPFAQVWVETESGIRKVVSNVDGRYKIDALKPGFYQVFSKTSGYDTLKLGRVELLSGSIATIDPCFQIGKIFDEVIVGRPLIAKDLPKIIIPTEDIEHSPYIRDPKGLIVGTSSDVQQVEGTGDLIVRGSRPGDAIYYIDGVKATDMSAVPGVAIRGLQAFTGGIPANYGDTMGGVIVLETKGYFDLYYAWKANQ